MRYYTKHYLTSKHNPILLQLGWQDQPLSNTPNHKNLAWALACNGFVGRGLADPVGPLPHHLHLKTLDLADLQPSLAPINHLTSTYAIKPVTLAQTALRLFLPTYAVKPATLAKPSYAFCLLTLINRLASQTDAA